MRTAATDVIGRTALLELSPPVLQSLQLATYDQRMVTAAESMGMPLVELA
jgi:hypothetical protein